MNKLCKTEKEKNAITDSHAPLQMKHEHPSYNSPEAYSFIIPHAKHQRTVSDCRLEQYARITNRLRYAQVDGHV